MKKSTGQDIRVAIVELRIVLTKPEAELVKPNQMFYAMKALNQARSVWMKNLNSKEPVISEEAVKLMNFYYKVEERVQEVAFNPKNN